MAHKCRAPLAELVDALDSKSSSERSAGSIPAWGTIISKFPQLFQVVAHTAIACIHLSIPPFSYGGGVARKPLNDRDKPNFIPMTILGAASMRRKLESSTRERKIPFIELLLKIIVVASP